MAIDVDELNEEFIVEEFLEDYAKLFKIEDVWSGKGLDTRKKALMHKDVCKDYLREKFKKKNGFDVTECFGVSDDFTLSRLKDFVRKPGSDEQVESIVFDDEFYEKALACKKIKLAGCNFDEYIRQDLKNISYDKTNKNRGDINSFMSIYAFYAGVIDGKTVLFKEVVTYPIDQERSNQGKRQNPTSGNYELKMLLGPNADIVVDLIRFDYHPNSNHRNKLADGQIVPNGEAVIGSHIHMASSDFAVAFPSEMGHMETIGLRFGAERVGSKQWTDVTFQSYIHELVKECNLERREGHVPCRSDNDAEIRIADLPQLLEQKNKKINVSVPFEKRAQKAIDRACDPMNINYNLTIDDVATGDYFTDKLMELS
ncbi:MAG: hypothetical protein IJA61_03795 [Clostridia bacterium]|nr:hypothetical protein [Clostridia bacterium]